MRLTCNHIGKVGIEFNINDMSSDDMERLARAAITELLNSDRLTEERYAAFKAFLSLSGESK